MLTEVPSLEVFEYVNVFVAGAVAAMLPKSQLLAETAAEAPGWTLPCTMILSVSWQFLIVPSTASVQVPTMPGPDTRILLKPVGEPVTRCGVALSPMNPAGGAPAALP